MKNTKTRQCLTGILTVLAFLVMPLVTFAQDNITVSGTVTDDTDQPVIGASVMVKGSTTGVPTDLDGKYTIDVPADAVLEFSSVGLRTVDIQVNGRAVINVVLNTDNTFLESVVVVGYGTQKKGSPRMSRTCSPDESQVCVSTRNQPNREATRTTWISGVWALRS